MSFQTLLVSLQFDEATIYLSLLLFCFAFCPYPKPTFFPLLLLVHCQLYHCTLKYTPPDDGVSNPQVPHRQKQSSPPPLLRLISMPLCFTIKRFIPERSPPQQVWLPTNQSYICFCDFLRFLWSPKHHFATLTNPTSDLAPRWSWLLLHAWQLLRAWTMASHPIPHPSPQPWFLEQNFWPSFSW